MNKIFEKLLYFFCFFPFCQIPGIYIATDVQPYALLIAILGLVIFWTGQAKWFVNKEDVFSYFLIFIATVSFAVLCLRGKQLFAILRSYLSYITVAIVSISTFHMLQRSLMGINDKWIKSYINVWLIVGVIQKIWSRDFMNFLVSNARTTNNRGVISFASEPSFYGYMCIFFLLFVMGFKKQREIYIANVLFQLFFLAQSSVALVYFGIIVLFLTIHILKKLKFKYIVRIGVIGVIASVTIRKWAYINQNTRMGSLLNGIFINGIKQIFILVEQDESIKTRWEHIQFCIDKFIENGGIPYGYSVDIRLESGYGAAIYELGIVGLVMILIIWRTIYKGYPTQYAIVIANSITVIMFSAIQLSLPTFAFFIGYCMYYGKKSKALINGKNYLLKVSRD